ncbi:MAG: serine/threonine protein kinase [Deltaproteobacteria bacterium]|nr:serine/threonine protein kinase [Deltaproteobacteria bacterium]
MVGPVGDETGLVRGVYELAPGTQLGEYRIEKFLGGGGMGDVFTAIHPKIGKRAAVKVLKKELSNPFNIQRFVDEAKVVNTIGHPNIVDIFAFGEMPDGRCYFVMELLIGQTLRERIARGPLASSEVREILKPLTRALDAAHAKGVIHRDLKPDNIFLVEVAGEKPIVKLLDFGIAKLAKADHRVEQTKSGVMVGTPQYIAPEQAKGHTIDARADIYALGGITFEMLTGRPPFVADNAMEMIAKHLMEAPPKPSSIVSTISAELDSLVVAMLDKEPARRPTLGDVALIIDRMKQGPIQLEDALTLSYGDRAAQPRGPVTAPAPLTPPPMTPSIMEPIAPRPVAAVMTPVHSSGTATFGNEPMSGAHTSVEPIVTMPPSEHTERDAVTVPRSRGLWIGVSVVVLGVAMILSFILVRTMATSETVDAAVVVTIDANDAGAGGLLIPDSAVAMTPDAEATIADAAAVPATADAAAAISDAASVTADAATVMPSLDAGVMRPPPIPDRPPPRPRARLVLDILDAGRATSIRINGRVAGRGRHFERELVLNQELWIEVISTERKPQRFKVLATTQRPVVNLSIKLQPDLMDPQ